VCVCVCVCVCAQMPGSMKGCQGSCGSRLTLEGWFSASLLLAAGLRSPLCGERAACVPTTTAFQPRSVAKAQAGPAMRRLGRDAPQADPHPHPVPFDRSVAHTQAGPAMRRLDRVLLQDDQRAVRLLAWAGRTVPATSARCVDDQRSGCWRDSWARIADDQRAVRLLAWELGARCRQRCQPRSARAVRSRRVGWAARAARVWCARLRWPRSSGQRTHCAGRAGGCRVRRGCAGLNCGCYCGSCLERPDAWLVMQASPWGSRRQRCTKQGGAVGAIAGSAVCIGGGEALHCGVTQSGKWGADGCGWAEQGLLCFVCRHRGEAGRCWDCSTATGTAGCLIWVIVVTAVLRVRNLRMAAT